MRGETSYCLSACQQYFLEAMRFRESGTPGCSSNNMHVAALLIGQLDMMRLTEAVQYLTEIHDVLRTRLSDSGETPSLIVGASCEAPVTFIDMSVSPGNTAEAAGLSRMVVSALTSQMFDLVAKPPWRCTVIRLGAERHVVCLVLNHLLVDGMSALKLAAQLVAVYSGAEITPAPASYLHFAERKYPADAGRFWVSEAMSGDLQEVVVEAPANTNGPQTVVWRSYQTEFGEEVRGLADAIMRSRHWTPFMVQAAAYCASAAKVLGRSNFVVATSVYRGDLAPTPTSIGCYLDIVYFPYRDAQGASLSELVDGVRESFVRGLENVSLRRSIIADVKFAGDVGKVPPGTFFHDVWIGGDISRYPPRTAAGADQFTIEPVPVQVPLSCRILTSPYQVWLYSKKLMPSLWLNGADGRSVTIKANASAYPDSLIRRLIDTHRGLLLAMNSPEVSVQEALRDG